MYANYFDKYADKMNNLAINQENENNYQIILKESIDLYINCCTFAQNLNNYTFYEEQTKPFTGYL